jgi:chromosome condensin MukBEF ATPase and DNA-binding subunit MukB
MTDPNETNDIELSTSEKLLEATRKTLHSATFKANQYKKIVQKKIDLNAVQKKIATAHTDLGKLIDDLREAKEKSILSKPPVKELFSQIDTLKQAAADLLADIEALKTAEEQTEDPSPSEQTEEDKS